MKKIKLFGMVLLTGLTLMSGTSTIVEAKEKSVDMVKLLDEIDAKELKPQKDGTYFVQFGSISTLSGTDSDMKEMLDHVNKYIEAKGLKRSEYELEISHSKYAVVAVLIVHQDKTETKSDKKSDKKTEKKSDENADKKSTKKAEEEDLTEKLLDEKSEKEKESDKKTDKDAEQKAEDNAKESDKT